MNIIPSQLIKTGDDTKLNILFVAQYYFANPDFVRLSLELAQKKHHISVATSIRNVDRYAQKERVKIFEIQPFITLYSIPHSLSFQFSKIYEIVQKEDIKIIHALNDHSTNTAVAALVSKLTDVPLVYTIQGPGTRTGHPVVDTVVTCYDWTIERLIVRQAKRVVSLSKRLIPRITQWGAKESNISVIPSGVDYHHFDSERTGVKSKAASLRNELHIDKNIVIGYLGRLSPVKGLIYLIRAVKQVQTKYPNIVLLIVGDGALRKDLEMMAEDLGIKAIFAGWQTDTTPYYSIMDIFVLPSFFEGLPNVILEAMAMGKPIVATNIGGNPDLVVHGQNGFLVSPGNVESLADAIETLILNADLRVKMGCESSDMIRERFDWNVIAPHIEKVYTGILTSEK